MEITIERKKKRDRVRMRLDTNVFSPPSSLELQVILVRRKSLYLVIFNTYF